MMISTEMRLCELCRFHRGRNIFDSIQFRQELYGVANGCY
jgi:hypothetical protein